MKYKRIASLKTIDEFRAHLEELRVHLPSDHAILMAGESPLARPVTVGRHTIGNRFCIHPMEGWDGEPDGRPSEYVFRRWRRFGLSGAKLIWGGEATAVTLDARANPNQICIREETKADFAALREALVKVHEEHHGTSGDLVVGLQLTHSGRFCKPRDKKKLEWKIAYHHPILDRKFGIPPDYPVLTDGEVREIISNFHAAAQLAADIGFDFVDIKHCHGYLAHEFLSARTRDGDYGGSFENRTKFLREVVQGIRSNAPGLMIAVRLSAFDLVPYRPAPAEPGNGQAGTGVPEPYEHALPYRFGFGTDENDPTRIDLTEPIRFIELLNELGIRLVNLTAGSPYYNPHIQRPALFPPSDGYDPPEDPLVGVARQIHAHSVIKRRFPGMVFVGTTYTYLQEYLPHVAQATVRSGMIDIVGMGRMVLAYPELPRDVLEKGVLDHRRICRTFSDCTTAPRNGLVSGCYPLDDFYKRLPEAHLLKKLKRAGAKER